MPVKILIHFNFVPKLFGSSILMNSETFYEPIQVEKESNEYLNVIYDA